LLVTSVYLALTRAEAWCATAITIFVNVTEVRLPTVIKRRPAKTPPAPRAPGHSPRSAPIVANLLLATLPAADLDRVLYSVDTIPLTLKEMLHKPGQPIREVYFPGGGFCSIVTVLKDGSMVEVATVGREGVVGSSAVSDSIPLISASMVQGASAVCYRMTVSAFRDEMDRHGPFFDVVNRFTQALLFMIMQATACNAVHTVEQRLARWLLMARDRMEAEAFPLTQEFAAMMLGATRPTVTVVAGTLQRAGLITYHRGHLTILDRTRLEAASCECYRASRNLIRAVTQPKPA
jgi:CRP-like cAMP-binding protein